jgi:hypothetical protein
MTNERLQTGNSFARAVENRLETFQDPNCEFTGDRSITKAIRLFSPEGRLEGRVTPEAQLGNHEVAYQNPTGIDNGPFMRFYTKDNVHLYHLSKLGRLFARTTAKDNEDAIWHHSARQRLVDSEEAQRVISFIDNLQERPDPLYKPEGGDTDFWTYRCRLPQPERRQVVLEQLVKGVHSIGPLFPDLSKTSPIDGSRGLSGALIGENNAEWVEEVIFARDPSKRYGTRQAHENDEHAVRVALQLGWEEVNYGPEDDQMAPAGLVRSIMGRNRNLYSEADGAFSLAETQDMLSANTPLRLTEGYLWAARPGWTTPYGEPAAIVEAKATTFEGLQEITRQMGELAWKLNRQDRWVEEIEEHVPLSPQQLDARAEKFSGLLRTVVFKSNVLPLK